MNIIPRLDKKPFIEFHPALEFIKDTAYVGAQIMCDTVAENGKKESKEHLCVITSKKQIIPVTTRWLRDNNFKLSNFPSLAIGWEFKDINDWISSKEKHTVDGMELFNKIKGQFQYYMDYKEPEAYDFLTLWTIGTYFFLLFDSFCYCYLHGSRGSGKSKSLNIIAFMAFNALPSSNLGSSPLFRSIQQARPTFIIDETEKLAKGSKEDDFRNILLSGYKKGFSVMRTEKNYKTEQFTVKKFEIYCPKILANINGIDDVLEDRTIPIVMQTTKSEKANRTEHKDDRIWQDIRNNLYRYMMENWQSVEECYKTFELNHPHIVGRKLELWKPILSLAKFIGQERPFNNEDMKTNELYQKMLKFAEKKVNDRIMDSELDTIEFLTVKVLLNMVTAKEYYKLKNIVDRVRENYEDEAKWINSQYLLKVLKRIGVIEHRKRVMNGMMILMTPESIKDLATRMGIDTVTEIETKVSVITVNDDKKLMKCDNCGETNWIEFIENKDTENEKKLCRKCAERKRTEERAKENKVEETSVMNKFDAVISLIPDEGIHRLDLDDKCVEAGFDLPTIDKVIKILLEKGELFEPKSEYLKRVGT